MANPPTPHDPPPSMSAADLRRRLLASTPPPMAAAAVTDPGDPAAADAEAAGLPPWGAGADLLNRLRMPSKSGPVRVPEARMLPPEDGGPPAAARPSVSRRTPVPASGRFSEESRAGADEAAPEVSRLKSENKELRHLLNEMKQLLQEASETEAKYVEREKALTAQLAEKDRQVSELGEHLQSIEDQIARGELAAPGPAPKTRGELEEWSDELEKESSKIRQDRRLLDDERQQLREDEEALEGQMRQMEVSMARERAMMARQETELKRLSAEIQHELEAMQRGDASLREQMSKFQRRAQEVLSVRPPGGGPPPGGRR